jgi:hypothetical protein
MPNSDLRSMIDRDQINDVEAILAIATPDDGSVEHAVPNPADSVFTWNYDKGARPQLAKLYEKAKTGQWNGERDLDWSTPVDVEKLVTEIAGNNHMVQLFRDAAKTDPESPLRNWGDKEWLAFGIENMSWRLSQFLHGEQGALLCTAKIVETVPWYDAKLYAATQVMDEARHVEVFAKYLNTKLEGHYPINAHLGLLLDDIIADTRWDMTYLGMQIMVEGLALAAFGFLHQMTNEPLLKTLLRYVMSDEARHVAFGVLSLKECYEGMTDAEIAERQEFAFEAALRMRDRFLQQEVWERLGVDPRWSIRQALSIDPNENLFQQLLFSKIVPNCKKLDLLDRNGQWLRRRFEEIGVIQFEDWADTSEEYLSFGLDQPTPEAASA